MTQTFGVLYQRRTVAGWLSSPRVVGTVSHESLDGARALADLLWGHLCGRIELRCGYTVTGEEHNADLRETLLIRWMDACRRARPEGM